MPNDEPGTKTMTSSFSQCFLYQPFLTVLMRVRRLISLFDFSLTGNIHWDRKLRNTYCSNEIFKNSLTMLDSLYGINLKAVSSYSPNLAIEISYITY